MTTESDTTLLTLIGSVVDQLDEDELSALKLLTRVKPHYHGVIRAASELLEEAEFLTLLEHGLARPASYDGLDITTAHRVNRGEVVSRGCLGHGSFPAYAHTVGLAPKVGCEVFCSNLHPESLCRINNTAASLLDTTSQLVPDDLSTPALTTTRDGQDESCRFRFTYIPLQAVIDHQNLTDLPYYYPIEPHYQLLVIEFGEKENTLPGEDGYRPWGPHQQHRPADLTSVVNVLRSPL